MMSYYIYYKPSKEAVDQKLNVYDSKELLEYKKSNLVTETIAYCMKDHFKDNISDVISQIKSYLTAISYYILCYEKIQVKEKYDNDENHEFWFCGRELDSDSDYYIDTYLNNTLEDLSVFAVAVQANFFDSSEHFSEKKFEIKNLIEDFCDSSYTSAIIKIMNDFKEFRVDDSSTKEDTENN